MFFDTNVYIQFVKDCRAAGIHCPIVPGIMCITNKAGFFKMTGFCKTRVPESLRAALDAIDDHDAEGIKNFGVAFGAEQCRQIMAMEADLRPPVLHFYTLNLEKVVYGVLTAIGLLDAAKVEEATKTFGSNNMNDDAAAVPVGSAWARVGDTVTSIYGTGTVTSVDAATGSAVVQISSWKLAGDQVPTAFLQKGHYNKVF